MPAGNDLQSKRRVPASEIDALARSLRAGERVAALDLSGVGLKPEHASLLAGALMANGTVVHLELGRNPALGDTGVRNLVPGLRAAAGLLTLGLESTGLGDAGGSALAGVLRGGSSLTSLKLQHNGLGDRAAAELADALEEATAAGRSSLEQLLLQRNRISDRGAKALASVVSRTCLLELDLRFNLVMREQLLAELSESCAENQRHGEEHRKLLARAQPAPPPAAPAAPPAARLPPDAMLSSAA
eukprot:2137135-Prymnesium_polylepis.1